MAMPDSTRAGIVWGPTRQTFFYGRDVYANAGPASTDPSHDLAHVLAAASGNLLWKPGRDDARNRVAEYNAVFIEHLCDAAFNCVVYDAVRPGRILDRVKAHARWFVDEHYAPFPMSADEAYRQFCRNVNAAAITRLSPYFFFQKRAEREDYSLKSRGCELQFCGDDVPAAEGNALRFQALLRRLFARIARDSREMQQLDARRQRSTPRPTVRTPRARITSRDASTPSRRRRRGP
jgi:hypothetical protein